MEVRLLLVIVLGGSAVVWCWLVAALTVGVFVVMSAVIAGVMVAVASAVAVSVRGGAFDVVAMLVAVAVIDCLGGVS